MKLMIVLAALAAAAPSMTPADEGAAAIGYICGAEHAPGPGRPPVTPVMMTGVGNGASPADTHVAEAQVWYDQGVNLYNSFNHADATAAFAKASALDPGCALCQWGLALSQGPTLNFWVSAEQTAGALVVANKAASLVKPGDARAKALIAALQQRYAPGATFQAREIAYAHAMDALASRYPADDEVAVLAAHALLTPNREGDFSGVPRAEALVKTVLARRPDDTAAIHFYIHAAELAGHAAEALPYAERLAALAPNASHLVHMGGHTLIHVGRYEEVALLNARAMEIDADEKAALDQPGALGGEPYYPHNFGFGVVGALMAGDGPLALKYADHAALAFPDKLDPSRRGSPIGRSLVAYGRFAPHRALELKDDPADPAIVRIYRAYAKGEAYAALGDAAGTGRQAQAVAGLGREARKAKEGYPADIAAIAEGVLEGRAAMLSGRPAVAAARFAAAAALQEKAFPVISSFDPPPWWYPVRRSLAAAEVAQRRYAAAEKDARASLANWPKDGLALQVLSKAEAGRARPDAAARDAQAARLAWRGDPAGMPLGLM